MTRAQSRPETRYASTPEGDVAFQVFGSGPPDLVFITNWMTNLDAMWEEALARCVHETAGVLLGDTEGGR
jgi:hypothetical protein